MCVERARDSFGFSGWICAQARVSWLKIGCAWFASIRLFNHSRAMLFVDLFLAHICLSLSRLFQNYFSWVLFRLNLLSTSSLFFILIASSSFSAFIQLLHISWQEYLFSLIRNRALSRSRQWTTCLWYGFCVKKANMQSAEIETHAHIYNDCSNCNSSSELRKNGTTEMRRVKNKTQYDLLSNTMHQHVK